MLKFLLCILLVLIQPATYAQYIFVLGVAQDGGYPHLGCDKKCCNTAWQHNDLKRHVVSLAVVDSVEKKWWLIEATPDIKEQLHYFRQLTRGQYNYLPDGIFITHAHIGHYTGLMQLGREVRNTKGVNVYALPKLKKYLETNGPWSQLVSLNNIKLQELQPDSLVVLSANAGITPFLVPHRDEYSETAGFQINTRNKHYLFIPDIDKWSKWQLNIINKVKDVDVAMLDGTFFDGNELPGRNMSEVPHPSVEETMQLFQHESAATKAKVCFIHFNHTNPLLIDKKKQQEVIKAGYKIALQGQKL